MGETHIQRAPPSNTQVESGTSQGKSGTSVDLSNGGLHNLPMAAIGATDSINPPLFTRVQSPRETPQSKDVNSQPKSSSKAVTSNRWQMQRYLAHQKTHPPRTLP